MTATQLTLIFLSIAVIALAWCIVLIQKSIRNHSKAIQHLLESNRLLVEAVRRVTLK